MKKTHGLSDTPIYNLWRSMRARCDNPNDWRWHRYGGRGIKVCDRWMTFDNFYADMGKPPKGRSLDRINNDGNYEPGNCWWATGKEQFRNRVTNNRVTFNGKTMCLTEWEELTGIKSHTIRSRIFRLGWTIERALTTPT